MYTIIPFEILISNGKTQPIPKIVKFYKFDTAELAYSYLDNLIDSKTSRANTIYCDALDEVLSCKSITTIKDPTSYIIICKLNDPIYEMADFHNIGFKNFENAELIIEYLIVNHERHIRDETHNSMTKTIDTVNDTKLKLLKNSIAKTKNEELPYPELELGYNIKDRILHFDNGRILF